MLIKGFFFLLWWLELYLFLWLLIMVKFWFGVYDNDAIMMNRGFHLQHCLVIVARPKNQITENQTKKRKRTITKIEKKIEWRWEEREKMQYASGTSYRDEERGRKNLENEDEKRGGKCNTLMKREE